MVEEKCRYCGNKISSAKDRYVLFGTYNKTKPMDESYFHFDCFVKWYNSKVEEKARNIVKRLQKLGVGLFARVQEMLGGSGGKGMEMVGSMVKTNLDKEKTFDLFKEEKKEKKDGRKKESKM